MKKRRNGSILASQKERKRGEMAHSSLPEGEKRRRNAPF